MGDESGPALWRALGASVRGAAHRRQGVPNQDAIAIWPWTDAAPRAVLAVADGHGSAKCFRSEVGAHLAVVVAAGALDRLAASTRGVADHSLIELAAEDLLRRWRQDVLRHLAGAPFAPEELATVEWREGPAGRKLVEDNPLVAYGSTVLAVLLTDAFILYLQLGDGDILAVSEAGAVAWPLPPDERLFGNVTTSLCSSNAMGDLRVGLHAIDRGPGGAATPPSLIMLSTDGYANAFRDAAGFLQVGADLWEMIRTEGPELVAASLEGWLDEASRCGSGDDVTAGIAWRVTPPPGPFPRCGRGNDACDLRHGERGNPPVAPAGPPSGSLPNGGSDASEHHSGSRCPMTGVFLPGLEAQAPAG